jgi:N-acyl-phosphatidylethanolamine-hydrolysing phospholipase D
MNPEEAVQAHLDVGATRSVAMHYGVFQLTTEGIDEPERALEHAVREKGLHESDFQAIGFGGSLRLE